MRLKYFCVLVIVLCTVDNIYGQISNKEKTFVITANEYTENIQMQGMLDKSNTQDFQPMQRISITNKGQKTIVGPRLIINDEKKWYTSTYLVNESVREAQTLRDSLLSIWQFVRNNRVHKMPATREDYIFYKMLSTYGYGACDVATFNIMEITKRMGFFSLYGGMTNHTIAEVNTKIAGSVILDSDIEVFYLKFNNQDLAGTHDVLNDRYLMYRTDHYGKMRYDKNIDRRNSYMYHNIRLVDRTIQSVENFDFLLKPQESIEFLWDKAENYFHYWDDTTLEDNILTDVVSNSKFIFSTDFKDSSLLLNEIFGEYDAISLEEDCLKPTKDSAYFIYRSSLAFPILSSTISGKFRLGDSSESLQVFVSLDDEQSWSKVWEKTDTNTDIDSFNLNDWLSYPADNEYSIPTNRYSLKFLFCSPESTVIDCGIDSLRIENTFQISKFFLPQLKLGDNIIEYTDANDDDADRIIEVTIEWQESWENKPPNKVTAPTFPLHQANVDSLYFAFTWEPATDDDGDAIIDYEFMLSDNDRMLFPHSPNFNLYVSLFREGIKPYYKVKETGWLNDGQTYYWRVRAKDARGTWGEWSDTWSFTPHGVMRPVNGKAEIVAQSIRLSWEQNPIGKQPDYYKIYASDETNGFIPDESAFFTITESTEFIIPFDKKIAPRSFYRITACDVMGQESLVSDVISIPYPYMYAAYDSIRQDSTFRMNLFSNEKYYLYYSSGYGVISYAPDITIISKPDWLSYDPSGALHSTDTAIARKLLYQDSEHSTIMLSLDDGSGNFAEQTISLQTTAVNNKPALMLSDSVVCENSLLSAYITSTDGDVAFGDTNYYTVL